MRINIVKRIIRVDRVERGLIGFREREGGQRGLRERWLVYRKRVGGEMVEL